MLSSRGIYFAADSAYSHKFAFNPKEGLREDMQSWTERPESQDDEKELFLAKLLVGKEIRMDKNNTLRVPPTDPKSGHRFNTIRGEVRYKSSDGKRFQSDCWVVYENGRAYPEFLVRYYRGTRDLMRTPFETQEDAKASAKLAQKVVPQKLIDAESGKTRRNSHPEMEFRSPQNLSRTHVEAQKDTTASISLTRAVHPDLFVDIESGKIGIKLLRETEDHGTRTLSRTHSETHEDAKASIEPTQDVESDKYTHLGSGKQGTRFSWEFKNSHGWERFDDKNQLELENSYQLFLDPVNSEFVFLHISAGRWLYKIDFETMTQVNVYHPKHRTRSIRRVRQEEDFDILME
jgi:hypothetical protein